MKAIQFFSLVLYSSVALAQSETTTTTTTTSSGESSKVIVIQDPQNERRHKEQPKVFVENGTDSVQGSPEETIKGAYRTWKAACSEWKNELKRLNSGNLLFSSCGTPKRNEETIHSQKIFTYSSKGTFKIRVANK